MQHEIVNVPAIFDAFLIAVRKIWPIYDIAGVLTMLRRSVALPPRTLSCTHSFAPGPVDLQRDAAAKPLGER
jgi:hypothetical protein